MSVDYLIIGNVTQDLLSDGGSTIGGTVTYSARTALAMGYRVGVVTSAAPTFELDHIFSGIEIALLPAEHTMTFENVYTPSGRTQFLHAVASPLDVTAVPKRWLRPSIVHLAPLAGECDPDLVDAFPGALVGVTPQGWMRKWDDDGRVYTDEWVSAADVLPRVNAAVMSVQDAGRDETLIARFAQLAPILAVTLGPRGCRVYVDGEEHHVPVIPAPEVDPTGAGDVFAAAFFVRLREGDDPWSAAAFANCVAALSVKRVGWRGTPSREEIAAIRLKTVG